jgi:chorismate mutase
MPEHLHVEKGEEWMHRSRPYYFFGPCSAESPEQLYKTAAGIAANFQEVIFRAGVWKPRTRPNTFEGIGVEALEWLQEIKRQFKFQLTTEVANAEHVEACLKAGIDILWIGARTTVNPFSVQEIADAIKGVDIPVFVKNPINPDFSLWMGALERINKAGIKKLGAIHRGFHMTDNGPYRNAPNWDLAIHLKASLPDMPMICDVSHISGKPQLIPHVAQKAIDLDMDGLMVETHIHPEKALSDREQQLTPAQLKTLIEQLTPKNKSSADEEFKGKLELLREEIDKIDDDLLERIATRMELAKQIGEYKKNNKVTVLQVNRWQEILNRSLKSGNALGLSEKFVRGLLNAIHDESIRQQTLIQKDDSTNT